MFNGKDKREILLEQLLDDNNLVRKPICTNEGSNSLMTALSHTLRFSEEYSTQLQHTCITHLKNLVKSGGLPSRLMRFHENESLLKQFAENPTFEEFEKINLELISLVFQVKVLVYHLSDDNSLMTTVVNNKFEKTVELLRIHTNCFEPLFNKKDLEREENTEFFRSEDRVGYEEFDPTPEKVSSGEAAFKTHSSQKKLFFDVDSREDSQSTESPGQSGSEIPSSGNLASEKKSKFPKLSLAAGTESDQLSKSSKLSENSEEPQQQHQQAIPIQETRLNSAQKKDAPIMRSAIKASTNTTEPEKSAGIYSVGGSSKKKAFAFFDEDLTAAEIKNLESNKVSTLSQSEQIKSPIHYINSPPPGITPTRYQTRTYGTDESKIVVQARTIIPTTEKPKEQPQTFSQITVQETDPMRTPGKLFKDRTGGKTLSLKMSIPEETTQLTTTTIGGGPLSSQKSPNLEAKKKPIVLEEGYERFTGKLKFFDEAKNFGFIVKDDDGSDIFVHFDDLQKAGLNKDILKTARLGNTIKLSFTCLKYIGKHDKSRKATDIQLIM